GLVRYVARTSVAEAFGLATSTKVSNALVAPSARIQRSAACVTPLALCPPARVPSGKYIDRSTTMSAGVDVPAFTAVTSADAEPLRPNSTPSETVVRDVRSEEHTSELQSRENLVCRLLLEKKK